MSFCLNQAGEITHPSSGTLACSYKVISFMTPRLAVLTSQVLKMFFFCMPAPTIPQEWTHIQNSGRKCQHW
uniref:Uncharacterized protein n=1 Tax=Rhinopithecus roxellana TaxID=61622 RepID=A0A2K6RGL7_RHIRO